MARKFKLNKGQLVIGGLGALVGIGVYMFFLRPMTAHAMEGEEYFGGEGEYESGLFVSYDDGFTVGNRVLVS